MSEQKNKVTSPRGGKSGAKKEAEVLPDTQMMDLMLQEKQIVATTFANLELSNTKSALSKFMELYEVAKRENEALRSQLRERDEDSIQVLEYLRMELATKTTALDSVERQLKNQAEANEKNITSVTSSLREQIATKDEQLSSLNQSIIRLRKELEDLSVFSRERQELLLEVECSKESHQAMIAKYERELTKLRFQTIEEKVKLKAAESEMTKKFNAEVDARATILVDVKAKSIHENNKNLAHDKALLEKEVSDLVTLTTEVQAELKEAQRCGEIDVRLQQEAMRHAAKLNKVARESDAKAQLLEAKCLSMTADNEMRLERERRDRVVEVEQLKSTISSLSTNLERHRHELIRTRQLSRTLIAQRSELENFFYDALEDVKHMRSDTETKLSPRLAPSSSIMSHTRGTSARNWHDLTERHKSTKTFSVTPMEVLPMDVRRSSPRQQSRAIRSSTVGTSSARSVRSTDRYQLPELAHSRTEQPHLGGGVFITSPRTGDPEEAPAIPSLRDDPDHHDMFEAPEADAQRFTDLSWGEKELVIRSLLFYVNQMFYQRRAEGGDTDAVPVPPVALPSQLSHRATSGNSAVGRLPLSITENRSMGPTPVSIPTLPPRPPLTGKAVRTPSAAM
ncbi:Hypothetical protein, putative [Bodo saltans]|uniref:Cilia- and flagella-associated protein 157 n=1 Tax=Bodo saltans TaxID=75058 RepID=A0A0S4JCG1_BODSA|nr:Hypothetical protein, putative [Bodo saltans]|eukprot:CUG89233.1 Hypothetical protein, putative [Bodo saltans]